MRLVSLPYVTPTLSATKDRRFSPITRDELPHLQVAVSLLDNFEHINDRYDWVIGEHGLILEIQEPRGSHSYRATFLPEIAAEQGWTREQTIRSLVRKSGYSGSLERTTIKMTRYRTKHHSLTYPEYVAIKAHRQ